MGCPCQRESMADRVQSCRLPALSVSSVSPIHNPDHDRRVMTVRPRTNRSAFSACAPTNAATRRTGTSPRQPGSTDAKSTTRHRHLRRDQHQTTEKRQLAREHSLSRRRRRHTNRAGFRPDKASRHCCTEESSERASSRFQHRCEPDAGHQALRPGRPVDCRTRVRKPRCVANDRLLPLPYPCCEQAGPEGHRQDQHHWADFASAKPPPRAWMPTSRRWRAPGRRRHRPTRLSSRA